MPNYLGSILKIKCPTINSKLLMWLPYGQYLNWVRSKRFDTNSKFTYLKGLQIPGDLSKFVHGFPSIKTH